MPTGRQVYLSFDRAEIRAMADRRPIPLELTFLGSGNAFVGDRYWSSFVLNKRYLFDAPPTLLAHLNRLQIPTLSIDVVFISHFHADHFFGLPFLFLDYEFVNPRTQDLSIVGPEGAEGLIERLTEIGFSGLAHNNRSYRRLYLEIEEGKEHTAADLSFRATRVEHAGVLDCFGYKVSIGNRSLSYTGDADMCDGVWELARDVDVLVVDCSSWEGPSGPHIGLDDIRHLRKEVPLETTFVLTHLDAGRPALSIEGVLVAEDFATFRL